ncbi:MAG: tripartite tricarboxylate transporter substrate binding protein [Hyphomicrobiales bacterium]|nr:tripartite tricarboxylate transporter substrate binding protein [Hyphomicrobiales bacterium]
MPPYSYTRRGFTRTALAAGAVAALPAGVHAQPFPGRTVTFIVPFSAGSGPDTIARLMGQYLGARWNQTIIVDNRTGASGNIGTSAVARATPDGTTMLVTANTLVMNMSLFKSVPYDPVKSFAPVVGLVYSVFACAVHKSLGVNTLAELVALAKAKPGTLNFGSPGLGSPHHVALELFKQKAGVDIMHVPYRQLSGAMQDLASGHIGGMFMPATQAVALAAAGDVKVLAFSGDQRSAIAPDVPTLTEAGVAGVDIDNWWAILAPAGTPDEVVQRYNADLNAVLAEPAVKARLDAQALQVIGGSPDRLKEIIARDTSRWAQVLQAAGIKPE